MIFDKILQIGKSEKITASPKDLVQPPVYKLAKQAIKIP